jgi:site-specific DNA-methyltransferase (adenine-specific)
MSAIIHEGDCLEIMPTLASASFDAIIADVPYGVTNCKWDAVIPFAPMWEQLKRIAKPRAAIVLFGSQPFTSALVMSNPGMFRHEWVWQKNRGSNFANTVREPMKEHESVVIFSAGKWTYNKQMQERAAGGLSRVAYGVNNKTSSDNYRTFSREEVRDLPALRVPSSVQKFNTEVGLHPTQKPVALMEYLIRTYTNAGDTVLDFTAGSGTTGVACVNTGRHFIGIEKEPQYVAIARQRIAAAEASRQPALFAAD